MKQKIQYTLLCKSVPEFDKRDGKLYTCSLGYCPQFGLIRVYPLPITGMKKWHTYEIEVEKNKRDSRRESWKLSSYSKNENWFGFTDDCKLIGVANKAKVIDYLSLCVTPSISQLNEQRKSIGVIMAQTVNPFWDSNDRFINTSQIGMFNDVELADFTKFTKETRQKEARMIFKDEDGTHNLQLNEWQFFEFQRKYGATKEAFRHINTSKPQLLLIGNMLQYQRNWMVLSAFQSPNALNQPQLIVNF
jgi:hypothetical protein